MGGPLVDLKARGEGCKSIEAAIFLYAIGFYFSLSSDVQYRAAGGRQMNQAPGLRGSSPPHKEMPSPSWSRC